MDEIIQKTPLHFADNVEGLSWYENKIRIRI